MARNLGMFVLGWAMVLAGGLLAHLVQTSNGVRVEDVRFQGAGPTTLSALLYVPRTATAARPAPAVLASHGYINTREMQSPFAIELARRGFVVLAMDMAGHGDSGGAVGAHDDGGPDALRYLQSLPFVDKTQIGLEGHSMGGVAVVGAAITQPNGYRSMVLEGSTTPEFGQVGAGTASFPRNLAIVEGQYDEFAPLMWHVDKGSKIARSPKLKALFGVSGPVNAGRVYGDIGAGTGRELVDPPISHPIEHFSAAGVGAAVDWFQRTLKGEATPLPPENQVWLWKEVGSGVAFAGFVTLLLGTFQLLLATRLFAHLRVDAQPAARRRGVRWIVSLTLTAALPAVTFYPLMNIGFAFFPSAVFPEWVANQLLFWALANGAISVALCFILRGPKTAFHNRWPGSIAISVLTVGCGYLSLLVVDALFKVDFRFWVLGLKPPHGRHLVYFLAYLPPFTAAFLASVRALDANLAVRGESAAAHYAWAAVAMAGGFAVLIGVQYASLFATGRLISPKEALSTIIAFQFVPLLAVVGLIGAFTYRRTDSYLPGALICAAVVTWYIVAGTATHWTPGWKLTPMAGLYPARPAPAAASPVAAAIGPLRRQSASRP
jgi:pimeloyl-ACP methyl ester carboxylesterase